MGNKPGIDRVVAAFVLLSLPLLAAEGRIALVTRETSMGKWLEGLVPGSQVVSPDNRHVAYRVVRDGKALIAVDGKPGKQLDGTLEGGPVFSADARAVACIVKRGDQRVVIVDGAERKEYEGMQKDALIPGPDGKAAFRVGHRDDQAGQGSWWVERAGGEEKTAASRTQPVTGPDGKPRFKTEQRNGKWVVLLDGKAGKEYDGLYHPICGSDFVFSPDGKRFAHSAWRGEEVTHGKWVVVVDGVEGKEYDTARDVVFSPDSKHVAYQAIRNHKCLVVVDGIEGKEYDSFFRCHGALTFDGPTSLHFLAWRDREVFLVEVGITT